MKKPYWIYAFIASGCFILALIVLWYVGMWNTTLSGPIPWGLYLAYAFLIGAIGCFSCGIVLWSIHLFHRRRYRSLTFSGSLVLLLAAFVAYVIGLKYPSLEETWIMIKYLMIGAVACFALGVLLLMLPHDQNRQNE